VLTINRKLTPQGKQNYGSVLIYRIIPRRFCIFESINFYVITFEIINYFITILLKQARIYWGKNFFM